MIQVRTADNPRRKIEMKKSPQKRTLFIYAPAVGFERERVGKREFPVQSYPKGLEGGNPIEGNFFKRK